MASHKTRRTEPPRRGKISAKSKEVSKIVSDKGKKDARGAKKKVKDSKPTVSRKTLD